MLVDQFGAAVPKQMPRQQGLAMEWEMEMGEVCPVELGWAMEKLGKISVKDHQSRRP